MERGSLQYKIFMALMAGVALGLSSNPRTHYRIYRELARELGGADENMNEWSEEQVRKSLYRMKRNEYIRRKLVKKGKNSYLITFELTPKGKKVLEQYRKKEPLHIMRIAPPVMWDGRWRFVIFDIPEKYRLARDAFRDTLKRMDFFRIQQSVWVHPYPCRPEIEMLAEYFSLVDSVFIFEDKIKHDEKLKKYFGDKGYVLRPAKTIS